MISTSTMIFEVSFILLFILLLFLIQSSCPEYGILRLLFPFIQIFSNHISGIRVLYPLNSEVSITDWSLENVKHLLIYEDRRAKEAYFETDDN